MKCPLLRWTAAAILFLALGALCVRNFFPPLPNPLALEFVQERGASTQGEPIITAGQPRFGDFLLCRGLGLVALEDAPPRGRRLRRTLLVTATAWASP